MKVLFLPEVRSYFRELSVILYQKEYLGFFDKALLYAEELFSDIENNLPHKYKKIAPEYFNKYGEGMFYAVFKRNRNTSWYVFFNIYYTKDETVYFVRYISNNHMVAQYL